MLAQNSQVGNNIEELKQQLKMYKMESMSLSERLYMSYALIEVREMDEHDRMVYHAICDRLQELKRLMNQLTSYIETLL